MKNNTVTKDRRKQSWKDGGVAATRYDWATPNARKSSKQEDIEMHVDFWHGPDGVDVKGNNLPDEIWIEFRNVHGNRGWLIGDAKWIAFEICEVGGYVRVEREELLDWCLENVSMVVSSKKDDAYRSLYQRAGREDKIAKIALHDLQELASYTVIPYRNWYISPLTEKKMNI
jgi:hypothetical protein|tara:strand:+ start:6803 stop:7318 length:516 start_codon:yes stop_codon:yes gene_type:complete